MSLSADPRDTAEYVQPEIVDYGDLAELTAGAHSGHFFDANFPIGRRRGWPGFSITFP
jgi:hypothetical protein